MIAILMIAYQYVLIVCDIIHLVVMTNWLWLVAIYRYFIPVEKKSISGQIALVSRIEEFWKIVNEQHFIQA